MATLSPMSPHTPAPSNADETSNADQTSTTGPTFPQCVPVLKGPVAADGSQIILRAHTPADLPFIVEQSNDPMSQRFIPLPNPYGLTEAQGYLEDFAAKGWETGERREFAIDLITESPGTQATIKPLFAGNVSLATHGQGRFELGFLAHPNARGRGVMTRAAHRLLTYAFNELDAQVIIWRAFEGNTGSQRIAEKLGFTITTPLRKWAFNHGELVDQWQGTLVRNDRAY